MKKTLLSLLLILILLAGTLPTAAMAEPVMITEVALMTSSAVPLSGTKRLDNTPKVAVPAGSNYALSGTYQPSWLEDGGGMSTVPENYTFEAGKTYYLSIPLVAKDGYAFASGAAATGNYEGRYKLNGTITLDAGDVYTSAITGDYHYGTKMVVVVRLTAQKAKDVYIDNTVDNSVSYITGAIHITGSGGAQAGYFDGKTVYEESASVTYSSPKTAEVQGRINDAYTKVYNLVNAVKSRGKSGEFHMSTSESTGKVWDNRRYETVEDGDAVLIGDSDYLTGAYGVGGADGYIYRTHIASGDYGKETFYRVEANGWVSGWDIKVTASQGGTASASMEAALRDTAITLTATPDAGYLFKEWQVVSGGVTVTDNAFTMPAADVELKAIFESDTVALCLGATEGGSYTIKSVKGNYGQDSNTGSMNMTAYVGDTLTLTATPDAGYTFLGWYEGVVGSSSFVEDHTDKVVSSEAAYSFEVKELAALQAVFEKPYAVTYDGNGGTGTMAAAQVKKGEKLTLPANEFTAPEGKAFDTWDAGKPGEQISVTADQTVKALWKEKTETPEAENYVYTEGAGATWTQGGTEGLEFTVKAAYDDSTTFEKFVGIQVDGADVDAENYTAVKGSLIITLKKEYLDTLAVGMHTLRTLFTGGTVDTTFTIAERGGALPVTPIYVGGDGGYDFCFSFRVKWQGDTEKSINWTLYSPSGAAVSKRFNKRVISDTEWQYEAWFASSADYYILEKSPKGYKVRYENVGAHAGETDRCYNGGTIINYKVPKTGDASNPVLWLACAVLGMAMVTAAVCTGKKRRARG